MPVQTKDSTTKKEKTAGKQPDASAPPPYSDTAAPETPRHRDSTRGRSDKRESSRPPASDSGVPRKTSDRDRDRDISERREKEKAKEREKAEPQGLFSGLFGGGAKTKQHDDSDEAPDERPPPEADRKARKDKDQEHAHWHPGSEYKKDRKTTHKERGATDAHAPRAAADGEDFGLPAKQEYAERYYDVACKECGERLVMDRTTNEPADPQPTPICSHCGQEWPQHTHLPPLERGEVACRACSEKLESQQREEQRARDIAEMEKSAPKEDWPDNARRKALVIACNYYGQGDIELQGPRDDAFAMRDLLEGRGYKVVLLLDQLDYPAAMRHRILKAMEQLVQNAREGDKLFLHFSGHGGQTKSKDADEPDGEDEGIYPADFKRYKAGEKMIRDIEMHDILTQLPYGATMTGCFDSCHSGSVLDLGNVQKNPDDTKLKQVTTRQPRAENKCGRILLWSGCMDNQSSMDTVVRGKHVGAMSSAFIRAIQQMGLDTQKKTVSVYELLQVVREKIEGHENEHFSKQTPVVSSNWKLNLQTEKFSL